MKKFNSLFFLTLTLAFFLGISVSNVYSYNYTVTIQPIQVGNGSGSWANSALQLFEAQTQKIWNQADIDIIFDLWHQFDSATYYNLTRAEFGGLTYGAGHGQSSNALTINMWFVADLDSDPGFYGLAWLWDNGVAIADEVFSYNSGIGRLDTIAHELGHNLGLSHTSVANQLIASGGVRSIPSSITDIYPDGLQLDQLTASQIATAQASQFSVAQVPEPGSLMLLGLGIIGLLGLRKSSEKG